MQRKVDAKNVLHERVCVKLSMWMNVYARLNEWLRVKVYYANKVNAWTCMHLHEWCSSEWMIAWKVYYEKSMSVNVYTSPRMKGVLWKVDERKRVCVSTNERCIMKKSMSINVYTFPQMKGVSWKVDERKHVCIYTNERSIMENRWV